MNVIVTGGAGYIGGLLIKKLSADKAIHNIIGIDLLSEPQEMGSDPKIKWIQADLAIKGWEDKLPKDVPIDTVVHCAFKIRNHYGRRKSVEANNVNACHEVFSFSMRHNIPKLIYLSTVSVYGARPENIGRLLSEEEPLLGTDNPYSYQKILTETDLSRLAASKNSVTRVFILRLNSVTGPVGQGMSSKFGLITFLKKVLPFIIEANPHWARQFIHEDDIVQLIYLLSVGDIHNAGVVPEVLNVAPPTFLTARDMGKILGKKVLRVPPLLIRPMFFLAWHISLGRIPTRPDSSKGLIYPINVDGSRIETMTGYRYAYSAEDALMGRR